MLIALEAVGLFITMLVPILLLIILLLKNRSMDDDTQRIAEYAELQQRRGNLPLGVCFVEFVNIENGTRIYKTFRNRIVVGRRMDFVEPVGVMYLENEPTISRNQLRLTETVDGMIVENLSGVNVTRLNGMPLRRPAILRSGDFITTGSKSYVVAGMIRSA